MSVDSDWSEVNRLAADLTSAGPLAQAKAKQAIAKTAYDIEADAKAKAPVDTGNLRNSIGTDITDGGYAAEIGPSASYGAYVEMGTRHMAAQPYLGPAFDRRAPGLEQAMLQIGGEIL